MTEVRVPASVASSVLLHAGLFGAYAILAPMQKKETLRMITNVDLLVPVKRPPTAAQAPAPVKRWNFLKMALPSIPKPSALQPMQVKLPDASKPMAVKGPEKIEDRGRMKEPPKLEALDLSRKLDSSAMKVEAKSETPRRAAALAQAAALEEVGTRRVRNLPQAMALEEKRREAVAMQALQTVVPDSSSRRGVSPMAAVLREATPPERSQLGDKMPALAPAALSSARPMGAGAFTPKVDAPAPTPARRQPKTLESAPSAKGVEIEGPLADRKIISYEIPEYPSWAKAQGIMEASVAIRFYVAPDGMVSSEMKVEATSGWGRLDRLAMDALSRWRFASIAGRERQWGVITFRFVME